MFVLNAKRYTFRRSNAFSTENGVLILFILAHHPKLQVTTTPDSALTIYLCRTRAIKSTDSQPHSFRPPPPKKNTTRSGDHVTRRLKDRRLLRVVLAVDLEPGGDQVVVVGAVVAVLEEAEVAILGLAVCK